MSRSSNVKPEEEQAIIGPLVDDGLKRGTPKALKGLSLSLLFCLFVCLLPGYRSQFSTQAYDNLQQETLAMEAEVRFN